MSERGWNVAYPWWTTLERSTDSLTIETRDSRVHGHHVLLTVSTFSVKHEAQPSAESEDREKLSEV